MADFRQTGPFSRQSAESVERLPGQIWGLLQGVGRNIGRTGKYLASPKAAEDYTRLLGGQLPVGGRPAAAAIEGFTGPTQDVYLQPGVGYFDRRSGRFIGPENKKTIVTGLDEAGNVDRTKSDLYKQYAQTPEGQFERYFQTPEMDRYFGAASRGKGAPKDVAGMQALAGELTAPQDVPLSSYYRAESAMGRAQMPEIQKGLGYEEGSDLAKWAAANPMLAQRLYAKQQARTGSMPLAPDQETVMGDLGSRAQSESGYTPEAFGMPANPVPPTEQPGPGGMTQGQRVDYFRGADNLKLQQAAFTSGGEMPAFQTTGEKTAEFLKRPGISALF